MDLNALVYKLCMYLWRSTLRPDAHAVFSEMDSRPKFGDCVFVDFIAPNTDPRLCFGILEETHGLDEYVLRLSDGSTQKWSNVGLHKLPKELAAVAAARREEK